MNLNCATSMSGASSVPYEILDKEQLEMQNVINVNQANRRRIAQLHKTYCLVLTAVLVFSLVVLGVLLFIQMKPQEFVRWNENATIITDKIKNEFVPMNENKTVIMEKINGTAQVAQGYVAGRWSWSFNASQLYNAEIGYRVYGPSGGLNLGSGCGTPKWKPFVVRDEEKDKPTRFPFSLEYIAGPENLRAWRSMVLITGDGREIMQGNDFHRNGFLYNKKGSRDTAVWAPNSTYFTNTTDNDPLTLKIEVFVDRHLAGCPAPAEEKPTSAINYEEECKRLPTNAKLYYNGTCYVGSNTQTQFDYTIKLCNDIPSAAISHLAWIESEQLLEMLRKHLVVHMRSGLKEIVPYYIGGKQFPEDDDRRTPPRSNWHWIDNEGRPMKPFPMNFSLWTEGEPDDHLNVDEGYAAAFNLHKNLSDVDGSQWYYYLCEYKAEE